MNRTGLIIALAISLAFGLLFGLYPELDLKVSAFFYNAATRTFPMKDVTWAAFFRDAAMWIAWGFVVPSIVALIVKLIRPVKPLIMSGRAMVFLIVTMLLCAVVLSNVVFKGYWGRPRPVLVTEFNGKLEFKPWWDPRGACPTNCSFFSGEGATAFWTYAPAALAPPAWRPLAYVAATAFGILTGGLRMSFGGHFFTDVLFSGTVSFIVIWLAYALIYRWPSTRLTDYGIDAWLTRFGWPGYRWRQKLLGRDVGDSPRMRPVAEDAAGETGAPVLRP
ncbi:phosphatase PAP2 family protein [Bradyrhizobium sp. G127]|jgi:membrane-associated PAP2 superfamily phosphatase|uniref:phosphatase PAP2 family protein n=1 Tax=Bradyrhizobium sp. G127 TaxID=2904800 RepID=UPI001F3E1691|nr:phosphatase PAP2 family protein [Bradyrhizobium sp. G127]MCF2521382.1 phosphatase PAP2 family protein [Bradyrhizobium sp. G127]